MREMRAAVSHRTILISDLHLGSYRCDAQSVLDFLSRHQAETLFLVGDVIDLWSFRRHTAWKPDHMAVIRRLFELARSGTRVVIIPGNHDGPLVHFAQFGLDGIDIEQQAVLETRNGQRLLVAHGHEQDPLLGNSNDLVRIFCGIGERIGEVAHRLRRRGWLGARAEMRERWSELSARPVSRFERALADAARELKLDGVICGHSHVPADRVIEGVRYLNCGDWMSNCTAIVEDWSGELRLIHWGPSTVEVEASEDVPAWLGDDAPAALQQ